MMGDVTRPSPGLLAVLQQHQEAMLVNADTRRVFRVYRVSASSRGRVWIVERYDDDALRDADLEPGGEPPTLPYRRYCVTRRAIIASDEVAVVGDESQPPGWWRRLQAVRLQLRIGTGRVSYEEMLALEFELRGSRDFTETP